MPATFQPIANHIVSASTSSVTFSDIPQIYTDLVLVCHIRNTAAGTQTYPWIRFNGDTGSNYSFTRMHGNESNQAVSGRASNQSRFDFCEAPGAGSTSNYFAPIIVQVQDYSNATTNKTSLVRFQNLGGAIQVGALVGLWRSTSAITSILVNGDTSLASGSTLSLYGVKAG